MLSIGFSFYGLFIIINLLNNSLPPNITSNSVVSSEDDSSDTELVRLDDELSTVVELTGLLEAVLACANVSGTTTIIVATIKDIEK
jgi:hypothetical protein